ncbi:cyclopropane fatty acid synthase [Trifolium pratense]|uniref:Cyclopropane fatty acid synthase n=2 Tax=Trifolium pratense TaxID=57577 RepID=A0A2K3LR72_TRIPR|nr:cyclopropane fatty acid synthase [Trifolium pratense]
MALGFDEKFVRIWEYYFDYCAAGFKSRTLGNYQNVIMQKQNYAAMEKRNYKRIWIACIQQFLTFNRMFGDGGNPNPRDYSGPCPWFTHFREMAATWKNCLGTPLSF